MEDARRHAPAALRNRDSILAVLRAHLPESGLILEIASGSGEHCAYFAQALPSRIFQPSDPDKGARASIDAWVETLGCGNVLPALDIDASANPWPIRQCGAVICINMLHISPWAAAAGLFQGAAKALQSGGLLFIYGPFRQEGRHTSEGNAKFDRDLRDENPQWGVRNLEDIALLARQVGFLPPIVQQMPSNNLMLVFAKIAGSFQG